MTEHFTFFESYYQSVKDLPAEIKSEFYDVLFNYALYDNDISGDANPVVKAIFLMAKPNLDKSKARREAGKQGGSKPQAKVSKTEAKPSKSKQVPSDKDKEKDKEKEVVKKPAPFEIIAEYKKHVSDSQEKINEKWTMQELRTKKHNYDEIITGIRNYGLSRKDTDPLQKLDNFIGSRIYLDYQQEKKQEPKKLQAGEQRIGGYTF